MNSSKKDQLLLSALRAVASAVNRRDPYTSGHSERVAEYCDRLAISLNLSQDHRYFLSLSAWLHDLGNLSTPRYILRKPSALLHEEMEEVRVHPIKGAEMLAAEPGLFEVANAIRHHHERFDGTGYPDRLIGEAIPFFSRIILVADAYEAITHDRAYRPAVPYTAALDRLKEGAGTQFDPAIVKAFVNAMEQTEGR